VGARSVTAEGRTIVGAAHRGFVVHASPVAASCWNVTVGVGIAVAVYIGVSTAIFFDVRVHVAIGCSIDIAVVGPIPFRTI
jgi:hypothetical protein